MTAYVPLRGEVELCLRTPCDRDSVEGLYLRLKKRFSLSLALEFLKLMALAHCMRACRKEFLLTVEEYKTAYGRRYTLLEGKYHQDMGLYLRYRLEYREAKHNFFGIFNRLEKAA